MPTARRLMEQNLLPPPLLRGPERTDLSHRRELFRWGHEK